MHMTKTLVTGVLLSAAAAFTPLRADAALLNYGADFRSNGSVHQVLGGTVGDDTGVTIRQQFLTLQLFTPILVPATPATGTVETPGLSSHKINSLELFIDATGVGTGETVRVSAFDHDTASFIVIGDLNSTSNGSTEIPVLGSVGRLSTPFANDVDNSFFSLNPFLFGNEVRDGGLTLRFDMLGTGLFFPRAARIDAANLQVDASAVAPEPGSLLLLGSGLAAFGLRRRRRS